MLHTASIRVNIYDLEDNKILVSADEPHQVFEAKHWLLQQPEVESVTLNSQVTYAKGKEPPPDQQKESPPSTTTKKKKVIKKKKKAKKHSEGEAVADLR